MNTKERRLSIWQDGIEVAAVSGNNFSRVYTDAMHYVLVYAQDGPVELKDLTLDELASGLGRIGNNGR